MRVEIYLQYSVRHIRHGVSHELRSLRPRYPAKIIADAGPVRVSVFHKLGSADIVSNAAPEPMRKPATSLREFVLSLRPHV